MNWIGKGDEKTLPKKLWGFFVKGAVPTIAIA
jgi:hypothetical protein